MKLLLDTHTLIWWDSDPGNSPLALAALRDPANTSWLSVVSIWEIVIKTQLGKLTLQPAAAQNRRPAAGKRFADPTRDIAAYPRYRRVALDSQRSF